MKSAGKALAIGAIVIAVLGLWRSRVQETTAVPASPPAPAAPRASTPASAAPRPIAPSAPDRARVAPAPADISPPHEPIDAASAIAIVRELIASDRLEAARRAVERWAADERLRALLDNGPYEVVALALAERAPADAAEWLQQLPASEARNLALATLAATWSEAAPQAAMQWAAALGADEGRMDAMQRVLNRWGTQDQMAAAQWLADHESHPTADALIAYVVNDSTMVARNPRLALVWAALISEPARREAEIERAVLAWSDRDRAAAQRYALETPPPAISPEQRMRLLEALRTRTPPADQ